MIALLSLLAVQDELLGTWEGKIEGEDTVLVFKAGGLGEMDGEPFRWTLRGAKLTTVDGDGDSETFKIKIEGDTLRFAGEVFKRRKSTSILGVWELAHPTAPLRLTLAADASGTLNGAAVRWSFEGGRLTLTAGMTRVYDAALTADTLTLSGGGLPEALALKRAAEDDTRLVGKWRTAAGAGLEFRADGSAVNASGAFRWQAGGGKLYLAMGATVFQADYALDGDRLILTDAGGGRMELTRGEAVARAAAGRGVVVNGLKLEEAVVAALERQFNVRILDGAYWYDARCGAWGVEGGPTVGLLPAGMRLGGALQANASRGTTGVFVNGRQLHTMDVAALRRITVVLPGRYWIDAQGNVGYEGNPLAFMNLAQQAGAAGGGGGNTYHSRNWYTGIGSGGDGRTSYVMGKDFSVIIGE